MAKRCEVCNKGPVVGRNISHAHNVTPRRFEPNLQRVRAMVNGGVQRIRVCTRCLRSGKVSLHLLRGAEALVVLGGET